MKSKYCFLHFGTKEEAQQALDLNNQTIDGVTLALNWAAHNPEYSCFVGDFGSDLQDEELTRQFEKYPTFKSAKIVYDKEGNSKGYGFVRFESESDQELAIREMNGVQIDGYTWRVSVATPRKKKVETTAGNTTVFVGGLTDDVTEMDLASHFAPFGFILHVKIPPNMGCGFVTFQYPHEAEMAISQMAGYTINGHQIRTSWGNSPLFLSPPLYYYYMF